MLHLTRFLECKLKALKTISEDGDSEENIRRNRKKKKKRGSKDFGFLAEIIIRRRAEGSNLNFMAVAKCFSLSK